MPPEKGCFSYEVVREGDDTILMVEMERCTFAPSIEDNDLCMAKTVELLAEVSGVTKIVYVQKRDYEYDYNQTVLLSEIAEIYKQLVKEKLSYGVLKDPQAMRYAAVWFAELQHKLFRQIKHDPLGAYVELHRILRREEIALRQTIEKARAESIKKYIGVVQRIIGMLENTRLITIAKPYLAGFKIGDRSVYRRIFNPTIKPDFMFTKLMATYPPEAEELDSYNVGDTEITMFSVPDTIQTLYHMIPPEFKLDENEYQLLDGARRVLAEHKPKRSEFIDPHRMREVFTRIGSDLLEEMSDYNGIKLRKKQLQSLTQILVRYSVGFGLIEVLLSDEKVQDVTINAPMGQIPMFVIHQDFDECKTNIIPTVTEAESWASKLRMISGRPLDEANPIMDTELELPGARTRIGVIAPPLNPFGLGYAFRRHRDKPWTIPLFLKTKMISPLAAGLMSFLVDGNRTMLVAGTRSAGKSSLLGSLLVEIMRKYRIITIEDTLELPSESLRKLGYNIQPMKVASAMSKGDGAEVEADVGIRTTLRLGDSALIVGEVRSKEARALYEAMRVGALANVVAGTIHGDSPYGVFDRVVNDLDVPKTSFKATDLVIVANPIRSPDGLHRWRRVTQITEIRKFWDDDPLKENGFGDLMKYMPDNDQLEPTDDLINGESDILKSIAGNVKEWAGDWDAIWDNITLRMNVKKAVADLAGKADPELLEAPFVIQCNDQFHRVSNKVRDEVGSLDSKRIYAEWENWLKRSIKKHVSQKSGKTS